MTKTKTITPSEISISEYKKLKRPRKYLNKPVQYEGINFDSKKEFERYLFLKQQQVEGKIWDLKHHKVFDIEVNQQLICKYESDFSYHNEEFPFNFVVEDVKSEITRKLPTYRLKFKLMQAVWGITIKEV